MFYNIDSIRSLADLCSDFYFVPSRFRQARQWFDKNGERCRATYTPDHSIPECHSDAAATTVLLWKWENVQGVYIYKDGNGWYADLMLCDGDDTIIYGTKVSEPCGSRQDACKQAEGFLHMVLALEHNTVKGCRNAGRFDWKNIWYVIIRTLSALDNTTSYPFTLPMAMEGLDNPNDHLFLLKVDQRVPTHLVEAAMYVLKYYADKNDDPFLVLRLNRDGGDTWALAPFDVGATRFTLICDFRDLRIPVLHLKTFVIHDAVGREKEIFESWVKEFPFLRSVN